MCMNCLNTRRIKQSLDKTGPLNMKSIKQSGEPEKKWTAEHEKYQAEPEKNRLLKGNGIGEF